MQNAVCLYNMFSDQYSRNLQMYVHKINIVLPATRNAITQIHLR
jgi:hypothetical protein